MAESAGAHEAMFMGVCTFVRAELLSVRALEASEAANPSSKPVCVLAGVPFDTACSGRSGARLGPRAIREASLNMAWEERKFPWDFSVREALRIVDVGDLYFDYGQPSGVPGEIEAGALRIVQAGHSLVSLGGDHFATYPLLRAVHAVHGKLALVHFDAHCDTWACEDGRVDHGTMFYRAAKEGLIDATRSVQIGIRTTTGDDTLGMTIIDARSLLALTPAEVAERVRGVVGDALAVYVTFDIDCLDPSYAPGTGTPVCGGPTTAYALEIVRALRGLRVVAGDVMEVAPSYDSAQITALAGATIAYDIMHLIAVAKGLAPAAWP